MGKCSKPKPRQGDFFREERKKERNKEAAMLYGTIAQGPRVEGLKEKEYFRPSKRTGEKAKHSAVQSVPRRVAQVQARQQGRAREAKAKAKA